MSLNRLAPEWERQDAIIIVWPHTYSDWKSNLNVVEKTYLNLSNHISHKQRLIIVAQNQVHSSHILKCLKNKRINLDNIEIIIIPTNDTWIRDFGPIGVTSEAGNYLYDFKFDAWGQKYQYSLDNSFNKKFVKALNLKSKHIQIDHVLEAGNIEINGKGEIFASKSCFRRDIETAPVDFLDLENQFLDWFGATKTFWIDANPLIGDDTDGHIDNLIRYCHDDIVVYASKGHKNDANNNSITKLHKQLETIKLNHCNNLELVPLPLPDPIIKSEIQLPASYANFLITNHFVFAPVFNDKQDQYTLKLLDELFLTREIIEIDCTTLIQQYGGIHCATMQISEGLLA